MNILGVGGEEFIIVIVIMLVVAGPKRMIHWMYVLGTYVAKFRRMWEETVDVLQNEFDEAGVGIQLPREMPTRGSVKRQAAQAVSGLTAPIKDTMQDVNDEISQIRTVTKDTANATNAVVKGTNSTAKTTNGRSSQHVFSMKPKTPKTPKTDSFGTWSSADDDESDTNFGTWSGNGGKKE